MRKIKTVGFAIICGFIASCFPLLSSCSKSGAPRCEDSNVKSSVLNAFFDKYKNRYADVEIARYVYHTDRVSAEMDMLRGQLQPNPGCSGYHLGMGFVALKRLVDKDRKATVGFGSDHIVNLFILKDDVDRASKISTDDYTLSGIRATSKGDAAGKCACAASISLRQTGKKVGSVAYIARYTSNGLRVDITKGSARYKNGQPVPGFEKLFP